MPIPPPPANSCFLQQTDEFGRPRIAWALPEKTGSFLHEFGCLILVFIGWAALLISGIAVTIKLAGEQGPEPLVCCGFPCFFWLLVGGTMVYKFVVALLPARPASLILGQTVLIVDPGRSHHDSLHTSAFWKWPKPRSVPRSEISAVRLFRIGERQRLCVDSGVDRIDIGPSLKEIEQEWLGDVLLAWLGLQPGIAAAREVKIPRGQAPSS
jgi:hypothetical protein